jgi:predicted helicase
MLESYTEDLTKVAKVLAGVPKDNREQVVAEAICTDSKRISWSRGLKRDVMIGKRIAFREAAVVKSMYRPFAREWLYFDPHLNEYPARIPELFPDGRLHNLAIMVTGGGASKTFSALVTDCLPNYHMHDTGQCFPLYAYEAVERSEEFGFDRGEVIDGYRRRCALTDVILKDFQTAYGKAVTKEDIFYYVYGILHSPEYRTRFVADLKKMLPRIPLTKDAADYRKFTKAGRDLAQWHLNYETIEPYPLEEHSDVLALSTDKHFLVDKMIYARPTAEQKAKGEKWDKTRIIYNSHITLSGIPPEALEYVVNGKPAIEWVMERYQVTVDKDSGIRNDPNDWAKEHKQPRYILDLVKRVVRVSVETMRIVKSLPALNERV